MTRYKYIEPVSNKWWLLITCVKKKNPQLITLIEDFCKRYTHSYFFFLFFFCAP